MDPMKQFIMLMPIFWFLNYCLFVHNIPKVKISHDDLDRKFFIYEVD